MVFCLFEPFAVPFFAGKYGDSLVGIDICGEPNRYTGRRTGVARSLTLPYDPLQP